MKIIHIFSSGISNINGVTNVVESLSEQQKNQGNEVVLINIKTEKAIPIISEFIPDIVSFHGLYYIDYLRIAVYLKARNIPYVIQFHGGASKDNYRKHRFKKMIANLFAFNLFVNGADATFYLSSGEYSKSIFRRCKKPFYILPNGTERRDHFSEESHDGIVILFFSRIDVYGKGLDVLAKVINELSRTEAVGKVVFKFYGHIYESSRHFFDQFNNSIVEYCGVAYGQEKDYAYDNADIVILPSRSEGMPLTVLEAFSYGRPVIVTPETNMGDVVLEKNLGWVSELTVDDLYNTIVKAAKDYLADKSGYRMRCFMASQLYSWDTVAKKSVECYERVLKDHFS